MYGLPVFESTPVSSTWAMYCDSIAPLAIASRRKRSTMSGPLTKTVGDTSFTAIRRPVPRCLPSYTAPIPPSPRQRTS